MASFRGTLSEREIADVAAFVFDRLVEQRAVNTYYHTAENGWPEHLERYGDAYPFVLGELPADGAASGLSANQRRGLRLFRDACVTCHGNEALAPGGRDWRIVPEPRLKDIEPTPFAGTDQHRDDEPVGYSHDEMTVHDQPPDLPDLSATEARGAELYQAACAECHAADGTGENWIGEFLRPHPPDFTAPEQTRHLTDATIASAVLNGLPQTSMPSFRGVLGPEDIDAIIRYMQRAFLSAAIEKHEETR